MDMEPLHIAQLLTALRGGEIRDLAYKDDTLQFRVHLPELASLRNEEFTHFLCVLSGAKPAVLQPFRNDATELRDLAQMCKLQLKIEVAEAGGADLVKLFCSHRAGGTGARLSLRGARLGVYDEAFDAVSALELEQLRTQLRR